ncbi:hypothetical protein [Spiroplasma endosymbiont of Panorpa germanica]|uniref:hypothetical protein n=1 Tax=Spiroplasma endosymbiont of Panorpa germanica TaxID=3066314 RepID=UPI0030CA8246
MNIFLVLCNSVMLNASSPEVQDKSLTSLNNLHIENKEQNDTLSLKSEIGQDYDITFGNKDSENVNQDSKNFIGDLLQIGGAVNTMLPGMQIFAPAWTIAQASNNIITAIKPPLSYWN